MEQNVHNLPFLPTLDVLVRWKTSWWNVCRLFRCPHSREGCRSARDLAHTPSSSQAPCALAEQTAGSVGGSNDDHLPFSVAANCGAERRHSSSWSLRAKGQFSMFSSQDQRFNSAACLLKNAVLSGLWSRSWILVCLVAAFKIFRPVQGSSAVFFEFS